MLNNNNWEFKRILIFNNIYLSNKMILLVNYVGYEDGDVVDRIYNLVFVI